MSFQEDPYFKSSFEIRNAYKYFSKAVYDHRWRSWFDPILKESQKHRVSQELNCNGLGTRCTLCDSNHRHCSFQTNIPSRRMKALKVEIQKTTKVASICDDTLPENSSSRHDKPSIDQTHAINSAVYDLFEIVLNPNKPQKITIKQSEIESTKPENAAFMIGNAAFIPSIIKDIIDDAILYSKRDARLKRIEEERFDEMRTIVTENNGLLENIVMCNTCVNPNYGSYQSLTFNNWHLFLSFDEFVKSQYYSAHIIDNDKRRRQKEFNESFSKFNQKSFIKKCFYKSQKKGTSRLTGI